MKKLSRILAVMLTLALLMGMVWVAASGAAPSTTTTNGFENNYEGLSEGETSPDLGSGAGSATNYSTATIVKSPDGNKYTQFAYKAETVSSTYRRDVEIGNFAKTDSSTLTHLSDYSYITVDFDLSADKYAVWVGYDVQMKYSDADLSPAESATITHNGVEYPVSVIKKRTYTCTVYKLYKTYDTIDEAVIAADIETAYNEFKSELDTINKAKTNGSYTVTSYSDTEKTIPKEVRSNLYTFSDLPVADVDAYMVTKGYATAVESEGATVYKTSVTLDKALDSKRLSYSDTSYITLDARPVIDGSLTKDTSNYVTQYLYFVYSSGEWQIRVGGSGSSYNTGYTLSKNLGEWNHFTYVIKTIPQYNETKKEYNYGYSTVSLYFNGVLVGDATYINKKDDYRKTADDIVPKALDWTITNYVSEYSMGFDNFVTTFYPVVEKNTEDPTKNINYSSGNAKGIDDLFDSTSGVTTLIECTDTVFNKDYKFPSPNMPYSVGNKETYIPSVALDYIRESGSGASIIAPSQLKNIDPPSLATLNIVCDDGTPVTLSSAAIARGATLTKTPTGYVVAGAKTKANMSLFTDMRFNLYIPKIEGVEILSVDGAELYPGTVMVSGEEHYLIYATPSIASFAPIMATVTYSENGGVYEYKTSLDPMSYATAVINSFECGSEEARLIYEMVAYKASVCALLNEDFEDSTGKYDAFMKIFASHENCSCKYNDKEPGSDELSVNYSALIEAGITSVAYKLSLNEIGLAIYTNAGVNVTEVSYNNALGETISHTVENGGIETRSGYYLVTGIGAAYIDEIMTIKADGAVGTYSLAKYIQNNPQVDVAKAMYKYALAAEAYKNDTATELIVPVRYIASSGDVGSLYYVEGYFAGVTQTGPNGVGEILLKDTVTDDLITVRTLPESYGTFPSYNYEKGDLIRIYATLKINEASSTANPVERLYLSFSSENPEDYKKTIASRGNEITYELDNIPVIDNWTDYKAYFNTSNLKPYSYVRISGPLLANRSLSTSDSIWLTRLHMNPSATKAAETRTHGNRVPAIRDNVMTANLGDSWKQYFNNISSDAFPGYETNFDEMIVVYTGGTQYYFNLVVLDEDWFITHEHTWGEWETAKPATLTEEGVARHECAYEGCDLSETKSTGLATIKSLELTKAPTTEYFVGDAFNTSGMIISAIDNDGAKHDVTSIITIKNPIIRKGMTSVTAAYGKYTVEIPFTYASIKATIKDVIENGVVDTNYLVTGIYVGVADKGAGYYKQLLLKDTATDDYISIKSVTYGSFPDYGYEKGDLVQIDGTLIIDSGNRKELVFSDKNPENVDETIISSGNTISYNLDEAILVEDWADMKTIFNNNTLEPYSYIHFKGKLYLNSYQATGSDNVWLHRVHMNSSATSLTTMKPDTARAIGFRETSLDANLGDMWKDVFGPYIYKGTSAYTSYSIDANFYALYTASNSVNFQLTILDPSWFGAEENNNGPYTPAEAIVETAYAFYRQGTQIQYDQYLLRRNINASPEMATAENQIYLDCSSFVNAVYYETFGENVMPYTISEKSCSTANFRTYARDNQDNVDVVGYWQTADYTTEEARAAVLAEARGMLEVGDVINYRRVTSSGSETGHVYVYVGNNQVLHCTGSCYQVNSDASKSYDVANEQGKTSGSISLLNIKYIFEKSSNNRYLFTDNDSLTVKEFCILRPLARGLTVTAETDARMAYRGLNTEKISSLGNNTAAYKGETITFTATVSNSTGKSYSSVPFVDTLPEGVSFVSGSHGMVCKDGIITANVEVGPYTPTVVTWTVRVDSDAVAGSVLDFTKTTFGGVDLAHIKHTVSEYSSADMKAVADKALEFAASGAKFTDPLDFAKAVYADALGVEFTDFAKASELLEAAFDIDGKRMKADFADMDIVAPYLMGGQLVNTIYWRDSDVIRLVTQANVSEGDVIVCIDGTTARVFVYCGGADIVYVDSKTKTATKLVMTDSPFEAAHVLVTLFAYDSYVTMRPSMR